MARMSKAKFKTRSNFVTPDRVAGNAGIFYKYIHCSQPVLCGSFDRGGDQARASLQPPKGGFRELEEHRMPHQLEITN